MEAVWVPGRLEHAFVLATNMRPADVAELAACGQTPLEGVLYSLHGAEACWAVLVDDVVAAMFGVGPRGEAVLGRSYCFWMLTTEVFREKRFACLRAARRILPALVERYGPIGNAIDSRYTGALRLAGAMGAEFGPPVMMGDVPFVPFLFGGAS